MHGRMAVNRDHIDACRSKARFIAEHLYQMAARHSTLAIEQAVLRAMGVASADSHPIIVSIAKKLGAQALKLGVAGWMGRVMIARKLSPEKAAEYLAKNGVEKRGDLDDVSWNQAQRTVRDLIEKWAQFIPKPSQGRVRNGQFRTAIAVATGSAGDDLSQVKTWRPQSDLVVITVPHEATHEGMPIARRRFFRRTGYPLLDAMRKAQHLPGAAEICWQGAGLPDTLVAAAHIPHVRLGVDPIAQIQGLHIDPRKAFVDYGFLLKLSTQMQFRLQSDQGAWGTSEEFEQHGDQWLAAQMILEQWVIQCGGVLERQAVTVPAWSSQAPMPEWAPILARNHLYRELFPQAELWQRSSGPQAVVMAGVASLSGFNGAMVSAGDVPRLKDIQYWGQGLRPLAYECQFSDHGQISRIAHTQLERALKELHRLHRSNGILSIGSGQVGAPSVFERDRRYWNPLEESWGR